MIFVTVGTQKFQFERLLRRIDDLIEQGKITEEVTAQIGHNTYRPRHYAFRDFLSKEEYTAAIAGCSLLITHSGVGSIITGVTHHKPVIVVPRLAKFQEHIDDHQVQIAESFSAQNLILMCDEQGDLAALMQEAREHTFAEYVSQREEMLNTIKAYLSTF